MSELPSNALAQGHSERPASFSGPVCLRSWWLFHSPPPPTAALHPASRQGLIWEESWCLFRLWLRRKAPQFPPTLQLCYAWWYESREHEVSLVMRHHRGRDGALNQQGHPWNTDKFHWSDSAGPALTKNLAWGHRSSCTLSRFQTFPGTCREKGALGGEPWGQVMVFLLLSSVVLSARVIPGKIKDCFVTAPAPGVEAAGRRDSA